MPLEDDQRQWLDAALLAKGKFTRAKAIKKDFEEYKRRREKAALALDGIPEGPKTAGIRKAINDGLTDADDLAKQGKFSAAYKSLNGIKKISKAYAGQHADKISDDHIRVEANILGATLNTSTSLVDFAEKHLNDLISQVKATPLPKIADTQDQAMRDLPGQLAQETLWDVEFESRKKYADRAIADIQKADYASRFKSIATDIAALTSAGHGDAISAQVDRVKQLATDAKSKGGRYWDGAWLTKFVSDKQAELKKAVAAWMSGLQASIDEAVRGWQAAEDEASRREKMGKGYDDLLAKEQERLAAAKLEVRRAAFGDTALGRKTGRGEIDQAPEPEKFKADQVLDDLLEGQNLPDTITDETIAIVKANADAAVKNFLDFAPPDSDEVFDLILKTPEELAAMLGGQLLQREAADNWSPEEKKLVEEAAATIQKTIQANCANRMEPDNSAITIKGAKYELIETLGEGGFGAARRYKDPATGKSIVVKSLKGAGGDPDVIKEKRAAMAEEMRTHRRALNGDDGDTGASNIVAMDGAAVSEDGSLHMVMEDAEGGDLSNVGQNLQIMKDSGLIPEAARDVLAHDMLVQLTTGLMALEKRGLVHNDIKPQNLLLTADGTVKIIDFGESRFGDETGAAPSQRDDGFGTTPGYSPAEQQKSGEKVTSKVDAFALGGTIQALGAQNMGEPGRERREGDPKPVTAMDRVAEALREKDPDKRPSLEAVLASSYMRAPQKDYHPEDVKDLKSATADLNQQIAGMKVKVTGKEIYEHKHGGRFDSAWQPFGKYLTANDTNEFEVPVALINTFVNDIQRDLPKAKPDDHKEMTDKLAYWQGKIGKKMSDTRDAGQKEMDDLVADRSNRVTVKFGKDKKDLSVKTAIRRRALLEKRIAEAQKAFYARLDKEDEEVTQENVDAVNAKLLEWQEKLEDIDTEIGKILGEDAKFLIAETKVKEVGKRFGPSGGATEPMGPDGKPIPDADDTDDDDYDVDEFDMAWLFPPEPPEPPKMPGT